VNDCALTDRRKCNRLEKEGLTMTANKSKSANKRNLDDTPREHRNLREPWKPGQSGNPKGRPKGARNRLGTQFLEALEADFNQFGPQAIAQVREKKPEVYMRVVADLLPKEASLKVGTDPLEEITDDELAFIVEQLLAQYGDPRQRDANRADGAAIRLHPHRQDGGRSEGCPKEPGLPLT
jgi:hypothetical protein